MKVATLEIKQAEYDYFNYLVEEGTHGVEVFNLPTNETLFEAKASFEDGYTASLEVYTGEFDVLCSVYLYSPEGEELEFLESDAGFLEQYDFTLNHPNEVVYRVFLEPISGTYADLSQLEQRVRLWGDERYEREQIGRTAHQMIEALETRLKEECVLLSDLDFSSPEALHTSIDEVDPSGQIRCEDFMDHSWEFASRFGAIGETEFENAQWRCLEVATKILQEKF